MAKAEHISCSGVVVECSRGGQFKVQLENSEHVITAHISGKIRTNNINIVEGDRVNVQVSPYDRTRGIIRFRAR